MSLDENLRRIVARYPNKGESYYRALIEELPTVRAEVIPRVRAFGLIALAEALSSYDQSLAIDLLKEAEETAQAIVNIYDAESIINLIILIGGKYDLHDLDLIGACARHLYILSVQKRSQYKNN